MDRQILQMNKQALRVDRHVLRGDKPVWVCLKNGQHLSPKSFDAILFQRLVFLISLYPEFLEKIKEIKKS